MRASNNAMVLFLVVTSGCFGNRGVSDRDFDGGNSSKTDSGVSDWGNTGGSSALLDARITAGRQTQFAVCRNSVREDGEICDGTDLGYATCESLMPGYIGTLSCAPDCQNYNTSMCYEIGGEYSCGNNLKEAGEVCDGFDLVGATCGSLMPGTIGSLHCAPDCRNFDTSMCYFREGTCGNGITETGEMCDGSDLNGATCWSLMSGYIGTLRCAWDCANYDTSLCYEEVDDGGI